MRILKTLLLAAPILFALRLERVWDSRETTSCKTHLTTTDFQTDFLGQVQAKYPIQENLSVVGRAGYKFQEEQPQYGIGLEYTFSYGGK